jgi:hypothetical protein
MEGEGEGWRDVAGDRVNGEERRARERLVVDLTLPYDSIHRYV